MSNIGPVVGVPGGQLAVFYYFEPDGNWTKSVGLARVRTSSGTWVELQTHGSLVSGACLQAMPLAVLGVGARRANFGDGATAVALAWDPTSWQARELPVDFQGTLSKCLDTGAGVLLAGQQGKVSGKRDGVLVRATSGGVKIEYLWPKHGAHWLASSSKAGEILASFHGAALADAPRVLCLGPSLKPTCDISFLNAPGFSPPDDVAFFSSGAAVFVAQAGPSSWVGIIRDLHVASVKVIPGAQLGFFGILGAVGTDAAERTAVVGLGNDRRRLLVKALNEEGVVVAAHFLDLGDIQDVALAEPFGSEPHSVWLSDHGRLLGLGLDCWGNASCKSILEASITKPTLATSCRR